VVWARLKRVGVIVVAVLVVMVAVDVADEMILRCRVGDASDWEL
jgi:hypothetical protein